MPVLVSSVLESSSLGLIGHILSYKPRSIHTPHPRRIASMAESALDGSALGRVRGVTPPVFIVTADSMDASKSQPRVLSRQDAERELRTAKSLKTRPSRDRILTRFPCGAKNLNQSSSATSIHQKGRPTWGGLCSQLFTDSYSKFIPTHPQKSSESYFSFGNRENSLP